MKITGSPPSASTMQNTYDNSTPPEILTDTTRGAVDFRRGSAADTDSVLTVQNNAGTVNFAVTGNGAVTGASFNGVALTTSGSSNSVLSGAGTYKASAQSFEAFQEKFISYCEWFSDTSGTGWSLASNSGTINNDSNTADNLAVIGNRAGVATFTSAAGALTGHYAIIPSTDFTMPQTTPITIKCAINLNSASAANLRVRFGIGVSATTADSTNQIACEITARTFQGRCKNGASASTTSSTYTMASTTWYTIGMTIAAGGGTVTFFVLDGATGASLFSGNVTTNIPSLSARPVFAIANDAGGGVTKLATIDNLYYERFSMGRA